MLLPPSYTSEVISVCWDFSLELLFFIKQKLFNTTTNYQLAICVKKLACAHDVGLLGNELDFSFMLSG